MATTPFQQEKAKNWNVLSGANRVTAVWAMRTRPGQIEAVLFRYGRPGGFGCLGIPGALHHDRQSERDDVEKTADDQSERQASDDQSGRPDLENVQNGFVRRRRPF